MTDGFPSVTANGTLFFVRQTMTESSLMKLEKQDIQSEKVHSAIKVTLPKEIKKIRYLESY